LTASILADDSGHTQDNKSNVSLLVVGFHA
jgi:hypothetical protein